jgi:hypothetical protein
VGDLEWRFSVVMDKFGPVPIDRVDFALADELVVDLCGERAAIERAIADGKPLKRTVRTMVGPWRIDDRSRPGPRRALDTAERVLRDAKRRAVLTGDVPSLKSAAPKADRPRRSFLEAEQVAADNAATSTVAASTATQTIIASFVA